VFDLLAVGLVAVVVAILWPGVHASLGVILLVGVVIALAALIIKARRVR
jgi:hypothetical protein